MTHVEIVETEELIRAAYGALAPVRQSIGAKQSFYLGTLLGLAIRLVDELKGREAARTNTSPWVPLDVIGSMKSDSGGADLSPALNARRRKYMKRKKARGGSR